MMTVDESLMVSFKVIRPTNIKQKFQFGGGTNQLVISNNLKNKLWII